MRPRRFQFSIRLLMVGVVVAAIWSYIIAQGFEYQRQYPSESAWTNPR
jgi:hypothetical protein